MRGRGSKNGVWSQKYQSCGSKKHAESTGQCFKRGHMLQVMAKNVLGVVGQKSVSYTHLRAHETSLHLVCRLLLEKKKLEKIVGYQSLHKVMFFGPLLGSKKGPRAFQGQDVGSGLQKLVLGPKISKLRIEQPCRIHQSMLQTGPYVASYGPKPF